ncbi:MAG TPA: Tex family protein [Bacilli bacterium]|nr:Tex family protein [Bacilli bacterium]
MYERDLNMNIIERLTKKIKISTAQIKATINLIDQGATIPFIARYRKEVTGNLSDTTLRQFAETLKYLRNLEERMKTVLETISEQGKLTAELEAQIKNVETLSELEDLYRPYRPKRKTRASVAREKGLTPLAEYIKQGVKLADYDTFLASFINKEKGVLTTDDALKGAQDIIAEEISDIAAYRQFIKRHIYQTSFIVSKEIKPDEKDTYGQYKDYKEKLATIPPHRILALNRGEKVKALRITLEYAISPIEARIARDYTENNAFSDLITVTITDSLKRLVLPSVENEIRADLFSKAEDASLIVFKRNLTSLLLYPPLKGQTILGFDPGFRTGGKYALVDQFGNPLLTGVAFLVAASSAQIARSKQEIVDILKKHDVNYIALGNGTASRESEKELRAIINEHKFPTKLFIVNESGASVYSASKLAEQEFPALHVELRSAISIARRLQDPLSELVKIDPKAIGVGQYQHDMNQTKLGESLHGVVEDAVNTVGVSLNNASESLLLYVAGISKNVATNILKHMQTNGPFKSRSELKQVPQLGPKTFEQCAGFLRIDDGKEPLDNTAIHPESYAAAKHILKVAAINLVEDDESTKEQALNKVNKEDILNEFKLGRETYNDIIEEIKRPGRDIREDVPHVELESEVMSISDLKVGMILDGTVRNIMDFGMFVDINVTQDGLVHISEIANTFIRDISEHYQINDVVKVKVISVDVNKQRIGLSIKQVNR